MPGDMHCRSVLLVSGSLRRPHWLVRLLEIRDDSECGGSLSSEPHVLTSGYCCAQKLTFTALPLCCYGKTTCTINVGAFYYMYQNTASGPMDGLNVGNDKIFYCEKCFGVQEVFRSGEPGPTGLNANQAAEILLVARWFRVMT